MVSPSIKTKLVEELVFQRSALRINAVSSTAQVLFKYGFLAFIASSLATVLIAFAGKSTHADVVIQIFGNVSIGRMVSGTLGIGGMAWGFAERRLRKRSDIAKDAELGKLRAQLSKELQQSKR